MANTTNLNLVKPAGTDHALVSVINSNMDIIDSKVGAIPANESAQSQITALNNQVAYSTTSINSSKISFRKMGSVVFMAIASGSYKNSGADGAIQDYGGTEDLVIPSDYRPTVAVRIMEYNYNYPMYIDPSTGKIHCHNSISNASLRATVTWII